MLALATLTVVPSAAQALTATSALIRVPTAHLGPDGLVTLSGGVLHPKDVPLEGEQHHVGTYAAAVTFLPFLELGFRFNKKFGAVDALGDRMVIARVRLVKEGSLRPAVVVGAHDFLRSSESLTTKFHALYIVGSKHIPPSVIGPMHALTVHLGYAGRIWEAQSYELSGLLAGLELKATPFLRTMVEYDGRRVNMGQSILLFGHLEFMVALQDLRRLAGGGSVRYQL